MKFAVVSLTLFVSHAWADAQFGSSAEAVCKTQKDFYKQNCKSIGGSEAAPKFSDCADGSTYIVGAAKPVLQPDVDCPQMKKHCTVTEQKSDGKAVKIDYVEIKGKVQKVKYVTDKNKVQKFYAYAAKGMLFCAKQNPADETLNYCELDSSSGRGKQIHFPYDIGSDQFCKFIAGETDVATIPRLAPAKSESSEGNENPAVQKDGSR